MGFIYIDTDMWQMPKFRALSVPAKLLFIDGLTYLSRHRDAAYLSTDAVAGMAGHVLNPDDADEVLDKVIRELMVGGLWAETDGGYTIIDWLNSRIGEGDEQRPA